MGSRFRASWTASFQARLGCPSQPEKVLSTSFEAFENGFMFWRSDIRRIYVFNNDGTWQEFADTYIDGQPEYPCPDSNTPSISPPTPIRGFGTVWCTQPQVRWRLGKAQRGEIGSDRWLQDFQNGVMLLIPESGSNPIVLLRDAYRWVEG